MVPDVCSSDPNLKKKVYNCFLKTEWCLVEGQIARFFFVGLFLDDKGAIQQESILITIVQVRSESLKNFMGETIKTMNTTIFTKVCVNRNFLIHIDEKKTVWA